MTMAELDHARWLLLIHQIPPTPNYFRVKIGRRLQRIGAIALKNSVYILPYRDATLEDFQWVRREIITDGGEATICEARLVDGLSDHQVEAQFNHARDVDYAQLADDARRLLSAAPYETEAQKQALSSDLARLRRRLAEVSALDFFEATGRVPLEGLLGELEARATIRHANRELPAKPSPTDYRGRVWVTRKGIHVDRIACSWLIRRFIDPEAQLKFVPGKEYKPQPGELRFDMFEAEFTHEGDLCSFEVLLKRMKLEDRALAAIAEIVHDIDLKDGKFGRPETVGIASLIAGIAQRHRDDEARLQQGSDAFEALYEHFSRKR
jgi:hypothetical protein